MAKPLLRADQFYAAPDKKELKDPGSDLCFHPAQLYTIPTCLKQQKIKQMF
jgi:hypothetical protein